MKKPEIRDTFVVKNPDGVHYSLVIIQVDHQTDTGTFKFFTGPEADDQAQAFCDGTNQTPGRTRAEE